MLTLVARPFRHAVISPFTWAAAVRGARYLSDPFTVASHTAPGFVARAFALSSGLPRRHLISEGTSTTPADDNQPAEPHSKSPFYFETGFSAFAKRHSRPFPPPFVSTPSGSFSDPLTTHSPVRGRRPKVNDEPIRGITNGDDAILIGNQSFLAVNDGVGAWAQKERGHAALWSRLIAHFWAVEVSKAFAQDKEVDLADLDPVQNLEDAYEQAKASTKAVPQPNNPDEDAAEDSQGNKPEEDGGKKKASDAHDILGTTTASSALLHYRGTGADSTPVVLATTLGDCKILVVRPSLPVEDAVIYRTVEQWHWFDCPRQLGTNSPDTPLTNAVCDVVDIQVGDVTLVMSDGVTDNLWEHEIAEKVIEGVRKWQNGDAEAKDGVVYLARTLMSSAKEIATDPNAESPYMERALDEGIAAEGGKLDDISVVVGVCRKRP